jgi:hypothetical protein
MYSLIAVALLESPTKITSERIKKIKRRMKNGIDPPIL